MRVYTPDVHTKAFADGAPPPSPTSPRTRRRRPPGPAEQKRREQWGKEWGAVGAAHKRKLEAEGK